MAEDREPTPQSSLVAILLVIFVLVVLVVLFSLRFANEAARGGL